MDKLLNKVNRKTTVGVAAFLISGSYMLSRVLGLLRDRLLASHFGIGPLADAYAAAFRLPELLFTLLVSGAFAVAFIPVLTELWSKDKREEAWEVSSILLNWLMGATLLAGAIMFIFVDPLTSLIAPGFDQFRHDTTVQLTRIMLITPFFFAVSSVLGSIQQSFNRFFIYAIASVFYNLGIIFGILFLSPSYSIHGVAIGVVIGTALQATLQIFGLMGLGYRYSLKFNIRHKNALQVLKLLLPRSINQLVDQLNYIVQTAIGSQLATGSLIAYYYANNLKNVPLMIFGGAIATAAFPRLARSAAKDKKMLIEDLVVNARMILFLVIPAATIAIIMRGYIVRLLFGFGNALTANTLGWFAGTIVFGSLLFLVSRAFYALQDSKTPLYVGIATIALNIALSIVLAARAGVIGLAMAQSAAITIQVLLLLLILKKRLGSVGGLAIAKGVSRMLLANLVMAGVTYILVARFLPLYLFDAGFWMVGPKFAAIVIAALVSYLAPCYLLRVKEAKMVVDRLKTHILRPLNLN